MDHDAVPITALFPPDTLGKLEPVHVTPEHIRHFMATALGQSGTPVATISARLGHRDKATTLNIYSHALPATDAAAADYMGTLLSGADPKRPRAARR